MKRFEIYSGTTLIGRTAFEKADAPMGVAFGIFFPTGAYELIRAISRRLAQSDQTELQLKAKLDGNVLPCVGVTIFDVDDDLNAEIQVDIQGVPYPNYEELFPHHVEEEKKRLNP